MTLGSHQTTVGKAQPHFHTADGTTTKITATDKPQPDENNEARDASVVAKARIEQRGQARGAKAHDQSPHPVLLAAARERLIRNGR